MRLVNISPFFQPLLFLLSLPSTSSRDPIILKDFQREKKSLKHRATKRGQRERHCERANLKRSSRPGFQRDLVREEAEKSWGGKKRQHLRPRGKSFGPCQQLSKLTDFPFCFSATLILSATSFLPLVASSTTPSLCSLLTLPSPPFSLSPSVCLHLIHFRILAP